MSAPRVSVLIPCYNASATILRAVDSALSQTVHDIEVLIADDGSTDDSLAVLGRYAGDPRVRVFPEPHRGGNATRNRLIELSRGEFVQFLDADDELLPRKIEACLARFDPDVDMVFTDRWVIDSSNSARETLDPPEGDVLEYFIRRSVITMLPLHRTRLLQQVGGFNAALPCCQEFEMHLRLARHLWSRVVKVPEALCVYHKTDGSVSSHRSRVFLTKAGILTRFAEECQSDGTLDTARSRAIAETLLFCTRILLREGNQRDAESAYDFARRIAPRVRYPARWPLRQAARILGPARAESIRLAVIHSMRAPLDFARRVLRSRNPTR